MAKGEIAKGFEVTFELDGEGFHASVPALKGCHSWGATREEARAMIREVIALWLEAAKEAGIPVAS